MIDGFTNSLISTIINVGSKRTGIYSIDGNPGTAVNPISSQIYVSDINSDNVSVIDGSTNNLIATVNVENRAQPGFR